MGRKKNILFIAQGLDTGGMATAFLSIAKTLERNGCRVSVVVPYEKDLDSIVIPRDYVVGYAQKRPPRIRGLTRVFRIFNILTCWRFYFSRVFHWDCDILVIFRATDFHWTYYTSAPIIGWLHEMSPDDREDIAWIERVVWRRRLGRYNHLIAVSEAVAKAWRKRYSLQETPIVIQNIVDIEKIEMKSKMGVSDWPVAELGVKVLLCVARLTYEKGVDRLLSAVERLSKEFAQVRLVMIGDGLMLAQLKKFVYDNKLSDIIYFVGEKNNPFPYMKKADLVVCPSRAEGMGLVPLEALIVGTPVLATDCGGLRCVLQDGEWGGLVENSVDGIYCGLRKFFREEEAYRPKGGFEMVRKLIEKANIDSEQRLLKTLDIKNG